MHTPGPWTFEQYMTDPEKHNCKDYSFRCQTDAADGLVECCYTGKGTLSVLGNDGTVVADMKHPNGFDAPLIAAAPTMLTALENCANIISLALANGAWGHDSTDEADSIDEVSSALNEARAAIAKATGKTD